jgi:alkylresorcinol/alkylpyrone synthase
MDILPGRQDFRTTASSQRAGLLGLGTAVPPHVLAQDEVVQRARDIFGGRFADFERLAPVFKSTGIKKRHMVVPPEWYAEPKGWPERTQAYIEGAQNLFIDAANTALAAAGCTAAEVDTIVTVSSTGLATPSLEARVAGRMGFRDDVTRVPVFGLGCAGGVSGLSIAARLAEGRPGSTILMVAVEICTVAFRMDQLTKANIVATALFGDGGAACVLRAGEEGTCHITGTAEQTWPDTLNIMGWRVEWIGCHLRS